MNITENSLRVLESRYLKKDAEGKICETPEELFRRVAKAVAEVEKTVYGKSDEWTKGLEDEFYTLMAEGYFMPNSPTLMNAGRTMNMLSACFVLPVEDNIEGIFDSIKHTALIQKAGGGTGFSFSRLRPKGDIVASSGGTTSGPISFLKVFSQATEAIQQGAFRRGANMGVMRIDHPDILEFIEVKKDLTQLTNYNLSVAVTDAFMTKLRTTPNALHIVVNPRTKVETQLNRADGSSWTVSEVWELILDRAWQTGEPGILFIDRANEFNPTPHIGEYEATNPCGEIFLLPYEACNLGSINIAKFVKQAGVPKSAFFDTEEFREVIQTTTRFLDNIIDANKYPLPQIDAICKANRKIGLGIMGFSDTLFELGIPYDSDQALNFGESVMRVLKDESHKTSESLSEERGVFPNWNGSRWELEWKLKIRNACVTSIAPTGTISIIANCSCGIEPMFSLVFYRNVLNGQKLTEVNEVFVRVAKERGFYSEALIERIGREGSIQHIDEIPIDVKRVFVTARDVKPEWHLKMQASFQRHCDSSISKTINFDNTASKEDISAIYDMAFDLKLKGVTIYRDGCRANQPMALDNAKETSQPKTLTPIKLPEIIPSVKIKQVTPFGNMHIQISVDLKEGKEREVFAQLGRAGDLVSSDLEAICRLLSLFLRCNGGLEVALKQLDGIGSSLSVPSKEGRIQSLADGLAKGLQKYLKAKELFGLKALLLGEADISKLPEEKPVKKQLLANVFKVKCPECEGELALSEGCMMCHSCGYSKC